MLIFVLVYELSKYTENQVNQIMSMRNKAGSNQFVSNQMNSGSLGKRDIPVHIGNH